MWWLLALIALVALVALVAALPRFRRVVRDHEWGLHSRDGRLRGVLPAGAYWLNPWRDELELLDRRRRTVVISGQEIVTGDNVGVKISVVVLIEVIDPVKARSSAEDFLAEFHARVQLALRAEVADRSLDEWLESRGELGTLLLGRLTPAAEALGLQLHEVAVRDVMFAADLRRAFHEVMRARKEGEAALERTRGETAALRNLANAARLLRDNPELLSLRTLQALERSQGNTFHLPEPHPSTRNRGAE